MGGKLIFQMSVIIESKFVEIFKTFVDEPLKVPVKFPIIVEVDKIILIIFNQRAIKDSQQSPFCDRVGFFKKSAFKNLYYYVNF